LINILICGGLLIDKYLVLDKYPARGGDGYVLENFDTVGGCAVNIAKTVKALGANPIIVSVLGSDHRGEMIMDFMRKERLPLDCVKQENGNTGYCFVFLEPDGERTFLTHKGCETEFTDSLISMDTENSCPVAAVTGYYLLDDSSKRLIDRLKGVKSRGCKIVFDPCPLADKIDAAYLDEMLTLSDIIVPNEAEANFLADFKGEKTPEQWALSCNKRAVSVVIKKGAAGGTLYESGEKTRYTAANVNVVDTTGAGDSFTGAIAYAAGKRIPLEEAVTLAAQVAGRTVSIRGPHGEFNIGEIPQC